MGSIPIVTKLLSYKFLLHFVKNASIGICFPSLEDFSFFLGVGAVEHGRLSASLPNTEDNNGHP